MTQVNTLRAILVTNPFAYPFEVPLEEQFRKRRVIWASVVLQSASTANVHHANRRFRSIRICDSIAAAGGLVGNPSPLSLSATIRFSVRCVFLFSVHAADSLVSDLSPVFFYIRSTCHARLHEGHPWAGFGIKAHVLAAEFGIQTDTGLYSQEALDHEIQVRRQVARLLLKG